MTNTALVHRYLEAWNTGDLDAFDALIAPDYVNHSPGLPDPQPGPEGLKPIVAAMRRDTPDLRFELLRIVDGGDHVCVHTRVHPFNALQMQIERIHDDQIAEHWRVTQP
ncbi:ester cyclase [Solirubrobacter ginsenosidimutans]|uniref:Ester cyclase n=1 Tax=Solirubrobacter ginsenosidimutans TaxID=490573 RepID=A0A9X3N503_9ACTN|nr:nuclear transport factor 2 family protein [Solirubrobacter ginsenosidimutans]MDA0164948.1 ester cyclase [Solirubrobacter ginsenosidimutans]